MTSPAPLPIALVYDMDACRGPTGVTRHALAQLERLARRPDVALTLIAGRISEPDGRTYWDALGTLPRRTLPLRTRDMLRLWRLAGAPPLEFWTGPVAWAYCPAEFLIPTRRARRAVTSHDVWQDLTYGTPRRRRLLARLFAAADLILSVSDFNTGKLLEAFPACAGKVARVPNAADDLFFDEAPEPERQAARADLGLDPSIPFLLSVANLQPRKNLPFLVRAAAALPEVCRGDLALVLVGAAEGDDRDLRAAIDALGPRARVLRPGYRQGPALRALYAESFALVVPSLCESFGIPAVEAMAQRRPVVLADSTALPEIAGPAGWYFDPTNLESLAAALRSCLDQPAERAHRIELGRARADSFRWSHANDMLVQALRERTP